MQPQQQNYAEYLVEHYQPRLPAEIKTSNSTVQITFSVDSALTLVCQLILGQTGLAHIHLEAGEFPEQMAILWPQLAELNHQLSSQVLPEQRLEAFIGFVGVVEQALLDYLSENQVNNRQRQPITGAYRDKAGNCIDAPSGLINCHVKFNGGHNKLIVKTGAVLKNLNIEFVGHHGYLEIDHCPRLSGTIRLGHHCRVVIEKDVTATNTVYITAAEKTSLFIGEDCMFATNNQIRTDDAHAIYDVHTGQRVNHSKDIYIGKHVWIGFNAVILGGSVIGDGSIVGMNSLVKKAFPNNCVIAGNPAKVVRRDIFWERPNVLYAQKETIFSDEDRAQKFYCQLTHDLETGV